ncbi:VRR-NUC domain-containing protein [Pseudomonas baltica]|uniref:VRR-NUC domain-containing protein n=1 Tax=Pseudomonas baltica TaxID=2762576 RepID=UPI002896FAD8|nr:VRR-NUC domain-containing protein [Pseudomonas baltica]
MPANSLEDPFYYLSNFRQVLAWLRERYSDVLCNEELAFVDGFALLDKAAQALLVRMIMRKGPLYRASKLVYAEIGPTELAVAPLLQRGWVDDQHPISLGQLFDLLGKAELYQRFRHHGLLSGARKAQWLEQLCEHYLDEQPFAHWWPELDDAVYALQIRGLCERMRLLFFGNLYQDWSEFVLADLGIYRYEQVPLNAESRSLHHATHIDQYMVLHETRQALEAGLEREPLVAGVLSLELDNPWLRSRRDKLLFQMGYLYEREGLLDQALVIYQASTFAESRARQVRVLERMGRLEQAVELAQSALQSPQNALQAAHNAAERQQLQRMLPRLRRGLGLPAQPKRKAAPPQRLDLCLLRDGPARSVEAWVQAHLQEEGGPVFYVENTLFTSLFGLLCWPAIFAPLPGAFFHPFQSGPTDLHQADFHARRAALFEACLMELEDGRYPATIRQRYRDKFGLQSPFVYWSMLDEALLDLALKCLPAAHLSHCFRRMLEDLKANCAGMPDLIQFWPERGSYRMIEVKGPGDRLQDNQVRWLAFCAEHRMPVEVCYVTWQSTADDTMIDSAIAAMAQQADA